MKKTEKKILDKSEMSSTAFKALKGVKIIYIILGFAGSFWLSSEIKEDPSMASVIPIIAFTTFVLHITSKRYRKEEKKEFEEEFEKSDETDEKIRRFFENEKIRKSLEKRNWTKEILQRYENGKAESE